MKTILIVPLISVLLSICSANAGVPEPLIAKDPIPRTMPATLNRSTMLQLVNKICRSGCKCGNTYYYPVPAVKWNSQLEVAAYNHSADMYQKDYFSHISPKGMRGGQRIEKAGYKWKAYGENIGSGYKSEKEVVEGWLSSPGHCKNIMNRQFKEMGVARVGNLWTQELAAR